MSPAMNKAGLMLIMATALAAAERSEKSVNVEVQPDGGLALLATAARLGRTRLMHEQLTKGVAEQVITDSCAKKWKKCGGQDYAGPTCCEPGTTCVEQNKWYSQCEASTTAVPTPVPSPVPSPSPSPPTPVPTPSPVPSDWISGTWTTGYWDCCKPSCSWPGKGNVNSPTLSCDATTGEKLFDPNVKSVCDGGSAASCADNKPFKINDNLSMGFAAVAVSGSHGLTGDTNCGQCYELRFVDQRHPSGNWGGSGPALVGKAMVVQVTNIGYDVNGEHSFDLQIPGAGQGIFDNGCTKQFAGYSSGDFDCDNNYGGCSSKSGCSRMPSELRGGCEWRYDWYQWLMQSGQTNNPYVDFRRVQCPAQLTSISGSVADDDGNYPEINPSDYA